MILTLLDQFSKKSMVTLKNSKKSQNSTIPDKKKVCIEKNSFTFLFKNFRKIFLLCFYLFFLFLSKHRAFFITSKSYTIFCLKMARAIIIYNVQLFVYNFGQLLCFHLGVLLFSVTKEKKNWEGINDSGKKLKDNKSFLMKRNNILRQIKWTICRKEV